MDGLLDMPELAEDAIYFLHQKIWVRLGQELKSMLSKSLKYFSWSNVCLNLVLEFEEELARNLMLVAKS